MTDYLIFYTMVAVIVLGASYGIIHVWNVKEQARIKSQVVSKKETDYANYLNKADYLLKIAFGAVTNVANNRGITKVDSKNAAIAQVEGILNGTPLEGKFDEQRIANAVEIGYQKYKAAGYDQHQMNAPRSDQEVQQILGQPESTQTSSAASDITKTAEFQSAAISYANELLATSNKGSENHG